ncbi:MULTISPECIES: methyltransferase domain-containing protein [unclassified Mesorhizobium]|uniref:methyltransferase domain-containing protein n=4 Tax=Mesorhizobium TaxID=68287 RepID=UPI0003CED300|nr:hypothetical protein X759_27860 [Mesorhizobium sp. LSHC420B00]
MAMRHKISYKERAAYYDVEYTDTVDHAFLASLVGGSTRSVLEIPCGVGRNALNLARSGCSIVAVDNEPAMVERLTEKAEKLGFNNVSALVRDLRTLDLEERFDLILVPREAFQLLVDLSQARQSLKALRRHLSDDGTLMIDLSSFAKVRPEQAYLQPDYFDPTAPDGSWRFEWTRPLAARLTLSRHRMQQHNCDGTVDVSFRHIRDTETAIDETETTIRLRPYCVDEFTALCVDAGLKVEKVFGDYGRNWYQPNDARMIFLLSATTDIRDDQLPPSGVMWELGRGFQNDRDAFRTKDLQLVPMRPSVRAYFETYLTEYFSGPFIKGQGAEDILKAMAEWGVMGNALDLGSGTSTLFWYLPTKGVNRLSCCDIAPEALSVLANFVRSNQPLPECYGWVADHFKISNHSVNQLRERFAEFLIFDCLKRWPSWMDSHRYDLITAFGNLAISGTADAYDDCFQHIADHLAPTGRTIGADWARRQSFAQKDGHDNSYLSIELIASAMKNAGLTPLECRRIEIQRDPLYDAIFVWVGQKNS